MTFSNADQKQILGLGLSFDTVMNQLEIFKKGISPTILHHPCKIGEDILQIDEHQTSKLIKKYEQEKSQYQFLKFIPSSGAGSRMFRSLEILNNNFDQIDQRMLDSDDPVIEQNLKWFKKFIDNLKSFAFYNDLKATLSNRSVMIDHLISKGHYKDILKGILDQNGLNYSNTPKGLIKFHSHGKHSRTPVEDHIAKTLLYLNDKDGACRIHFTVSPKHLDLFQKHLKQAKVLFGLADIKLELFVSIQKSSTNTITVDLDNQPFRNSRKELVFSPGGHGSLLENLQDIQTDFIFIENIDNISHERFFNKVVPHTKVLLGKLLEVQERCHAYLRQLTGKETITQPKLESIKEYCIKQLRVFLPQQLSRQELKSTLISKLNRPIRVCGMIKNNGDPGGFPFWVKRSNGDISLQIVEASQVNLNDENQIKLHSESTHFNPVKIACSLKDYTGKPFKLSQYIDVDTSFISCKTAHGKPIQILEHPGLWNGSMADWNTIFIEQPFYTFSPVKQVMDLLKPEHQSL